MKKLFSILLILALSISILAGCGFPQESSTSQPEASAPQESSGEKTPEAAPEKSPEVPQDESVTINFRTFRVDDAEVMNKLVEKFQSENPGITVNYTAEADEATYYQKLQADLLSGSDVDVFDVHMRKEYYTYLNNGYLADLSGLSFNANYDAGAMALTAVDGINYGYLNCVSAIPVMYNKEIFAENGWNVPETYEELVALVNASREAGFGGISYCGATVAGEWMAKIVMTDNLGTDGYAAWMAGIDNGSITSVEGDAANALEYMARINADKVLFDNPEAMTYDQSISLFAQGVASMLIMGSWDLANLDTTYADIDVGIFALPVTNGTAPTYCESNQVTCVYAGSEKADAAKKFVDFLAAPENVVIYQEVAKTIPTIAGGAVDSEAGNLVSELLAEHPMVVLPVINAEHSDVWSSIISNMNADLLYGSGDTDAAFAQVEQLLTEANLAN